MCCAVPCAYDRASPVEQRHRVLCCAAHAGRGLEAHDGAAQPGPPASPQAPGRDAGAAPAQSAAAPAAKAGLAGSVQGLLLPPRPPPPHAQRQRVPAAAAAEDGGPKGTARGGLASSLGDLLGAAAAQRAGSGNGSSRSSGAGGTEAADAAARVAAAPRAQRAGSLVSGVDQLLGGQAMRPGWEAVDVSDGSGAQGATPRGLLASSIGHSLGQQQPAEQQLQRYGLGERAGGISRDEEVALRQNVLYDEERHRCVAKVICLFDLSSHPSRAHEVARLAA